MRCLRDRGKTSDRQILALIQVPGWVLEPRKDLYDRLKLRSHSVKPMPVPVTTHWLHNMSQDKILSTLSAMGFRNKSRDNIKIVFVPCYLDGNDGIFDMTYYELLIGQDLAIYPSYYRRGAIRRLRALRSRCLPLRPIWRDSGYGSTVW